jgi:hypothetical protein
VCDAETATWPGRLNRAFHVRGRLRDRGVKATIFALSLRPRVSFDGDWGPFQVFTVVP